jgi:isopropylmalate/homocitrate/citramalate synthase
MLPGEVRERVAAMKTALRCQIGFHGHNNLGLAIGNNLAAIEAGVDVVDGSLRAFGAGGGNAPTETLVAVLKRMGANIGADLYKTLDAAKIVDDYKRPCSAMPACTPVSCSIPCARPNDSTSMPATFSSNSVVGASSAARKT